MNAKYIGTGNGCLNAFDIMLIWRVKLLIALKDILIIINNDTIKLNTHCIHRVAFWVRATPTRVNRIRREVKLSS